MKKKNKGKGLSVLSGRALYDYDATLFEVRQQETAANKPQMAALRTTPTLWPVRHVDACGGREQHWLSFIVTGSYWAILPLGKFGPTAT